MTRLVIELILLLLFVPLFNYAQNIIRQHHDTLFLMNMATGDSQRIVMPLQLSNNISDSLGIGGMATAKLFVADSNYIGYPMPPKGTLVHLVSTNVNQNGRVTFTTYNNANIQGAAFTGQRAMGTISNPQPVTADGILVVLNGMGYGTNRWPGASSGSVAIRAESVFTNTSKPTYVSILTSPSGDTVNVERLRISSAGVLSLPAYTTGFLQSNSSGVVSSSALTNGQVVAALGFTPAGADSVTFQTKYRSDTNRVNAYTALAGKLTANQNITLSGDITGSGATAITTTLANSGVSAGTYEQSTVNAKGIVTAGYNPTVNVSVTRPINSTTFTVSTTKQAFVSYNVTISCTATIGSAAVGSVALQYSTNAGSTWNTVGTVSNSNTVTLAIVLNSVQVSGVQVSGYIPANALVRMAQSVTGTTTITYLTGTEVY